MKHKEANPKTYVGIIIWLIATCFYLYENLLQVSQGVIVPELMFDFKVNAHELSASLGSVFLITYSACQFPVGILLDRINTKILLPVASFVCAISCYFYSNAASLDLATFTRAIMGMGAAFAALSCLKISGTWFHHKRFALMTGLMLSIGLSGSILGEAPLLLLTKSVGWRTALEYISYIGFFLTLVILLVVKDGPKKKPPENKSISSILNELKYLLIQKNVWLVATYGMLMFTPFLVLSNLWGPTYISANYNLDRITATHIFEMIFLGFILGAPFFGWLSDYIGLRKVPLAIGSFGSLLVMILIVYVQFKSIYVISLLFFLLGLLTSAFLPAFTIMKEITGNEVTSSALGFMNTLNSLGAPILLYLIGIILDISWNGTLESGIRSYSASDFKNAFSLFPLLYILASYCLYMIPETYCKQVHRSQL